jgi:glycosyltransferase involved in cell wall biosynthesis
MLPTTQKILVYLPALNEESKIGEVIRSIPKIYSDREIDILVVNDGSTDKTAQIAQTSGGTVISHSYNKGLSAALQTAIEFALEKKYSILVSMDADGQFNSNDIPRIVAPLIEGVSDFSIGNRFYIGRPENMPRIKYIGNAWVSSIVSFVGGTKIEDASCGFRAYNQNAMLNLNLLGRFTYTHETILDLLDKNLRVAQVEVQVVYFKDRTSRIANNVWSYGLKIIPIIFKCLKDYKPFRFFMFLALMVYLISFLIGGFVTVHWIQNGEITPYKSFGIFALALLGLGVLLTVLALIADMMNRLRRNQEKMLLQQKIFNLKNQNFS